MKFRTIIICAVAVAVLAAGSAIAMAPSVAEETYTPPVLNCESWEAPGWLNEQGDPTGCVDNAPCPEARKGLPCPADIPVPAPAPEAPAPAPVAAPEPVATEPNTNTGCN